MSTTTDFLIVGGGTAGLLLASRLARTPSKPSVTVLEAGVDRSSTSYRNPSERFMLAFTNPELDYGYSTTPQVGLQERTLPYMRGKGLGGSSLINFMVYLSGSKEDYNYWAELVGDDTWKWENTKRRLTELETFHGDVAPEHRAFAYSNDGDHGQSGPVDISLPYAWERGTNEIVQEVTKYGIPLNPDLNSGNPIGLGIGPNVAHDGYRTTSATANLKNKPENLLIWTEATVKKIILDGLRATGVELVDGRKVFAKKEVILSAGAFHTPKILMLSGIGPREDLTKHGLETIKHLPGIGKSMKDHAAVFLTALMKPGFTERMAFETDAAAREAAAAQWKKDGTGRLSTELQSVPVMFNKLRSIYDTEEFRKLPEDVKEYLQRETVPTYEAAFNGPKFPPNLEISPGMEYAGITVFGMNTQGEGKVTLASSNPADAMIIDPNTFTHPFDRRVLIDSLAETLKIFRSTRQYKEGFVSWLMGPKSESREDIETFLEEQTLLVWHASGTAKMGKAEDKSACVGSDFRVRGFEGLRVVDMSVAAVNINGHTQAVAYLIGATAAEKLIEEYQL